MPTRDSNFAVTSELRGDSNKSANNRRTWRDFVLRGGRVTKYKGIGCGIAPHSRGVCAVLGAVAASAFAVVTLTTPAALAGSCSNAAISTCSGAAGAPGTDAPVAINQPSPITVTTDPGFGINAGGGFAAITITGTGVGDITFTDVNQSAITSTSNVGIRVYSQNTGAVGIETNGVITSASTGVGVDVGANTTDVIVKVNDVDAGGHGIHVLGNAGTGDVSITARDIDADAIGINFDNGPATNDFTVDVNKITSGSHGIYGFASGDGDVNITIHDSIDAAGHGIWLDVDASPGGGLVDINVGNIKAGGEGINLDTNANTTDLTIDVNNIESTASGIHFVHRGTGKTTVIANDITASGAGSNGIWFDTYGSDDVSVTAHDIDAGFIGVWFDTYWTTKNLDVDINKITSGDDGINGIHSGDGEVNITVHDSIVSGDDAIEFYADNADVKKVNVNVHDAKGADNAIFIGSSSAALADPTLNDVNITTTGHIEAGNWAIWTQTNAGVMSNITVKAGSVLESTNGIAIGNNGGDSHVIIENAVEVVDDINTPDVEKSSVNGVIRLGGGGDRLDLHGGFSGITEVNGGGGGTNTDDVLNLLQANSTYNAGQIVGWDVFNIDGSYLTTDGGLGGNLVVGTAHVAGTGIFLTNGSTLESNQPGMNIYGNLTLAAGTTYLSDVNDDAGNPGVGDTFITGFLNNNGTVSIADEAADDNVRVDGLYSGNGGRVVLDTVLGDDSSATDVMILRGGTAMGTTNLVVNNVGGAGAKTLNDGIKVVDVTGDSLGTFSLVGDYEIAGQQAVIAGAYGYTLWKNGVNNTDGDWYLRSQFGAGGPGGPIYAPSVPIYEAYGQVLLGLNGLPTLQQRVGNRYWKDAVSSAQDAAAAAPDVVTAAADIVGATTPAIDQSGVWGVIEGSYAEYDPDTSTSGAEYDLSIWKMRAGIDGLVSESERGKIIAGLNGFYGQGTSDISSIFGSGDISTDAYGLGATATWYDNNGFYLDGQGQLSWFDSDLKSDLVGELASGNNGFGYALSLEAGQRIDMQNNWTVIPQAQLVYSNVRFDSFDDQFGAEVKTDTADSLRGRVGLAMEHQNSWADEQGQVERATLYGITNLHYEFLDGVSIDVADTEIVSENDALWGEVGLGGSYNWNDDGYSIYGEISANSSLENVGDSYVLSGKGGLRINW